MRSSGKLHIIEGSRRRRSPASLARTTLRSASLFHTPGLSFPFEEDDMTTEYHPRRPTTRSPQKSAACARRAAPTSAPVARRMGRALASGIAALGLTLALVLAGCGARAHQNNPGVTGTTTQQTTTGANNPTATSGGSTSSSAAQQVINLDNQTQNDANSLNSAQNDANTDYSNMDNPQ